MQGSKWQPRCPRANQIASSELHVNLMLGIPWRMRLVPDLICMMFKACSIYRHGEVPWKKLKSPQSRTLIMSVVEIYLHIPCTLRDEIAPL